MEELDETAILKELLFERDLQCLIEYYLVYLTTIHVNEFDVYSNSLPPNRRKFLLETFP